MNPEQLTQTFIDHMGPEWWDAKVQSVLYGSTLMFNIGLALVVITVAVTLAIAYRIREDTFDSGMTIVVGLFFAVIAGIMPLAAHEGTVRPEWVAYREVLSEVSGLLR
jgi:hypothetical protein